MSETFSQQLRQRFTDESSGCEIAHKQITLELTPEHLLSVCLSLRDEEAFAFEQLSDLCAVDYSSFGQSDWDTQNTSKTGFSRAVDKDIPAESRQTKDRFAVVYHLLSMKYNRRLRIRCFLDSESLLIPSVIDIWPSANWYEREAFDLFGVLFEGHPDLRRLLTDYGFIGHPFRKDFPLEGKVEVRYDSVKERVVYEPVSITNRVLVPKVIRHDNRYQEAEKEESQGNRE